MPQGGGGNVFGAVAAAEEEESEREGLAGERERGGRGGRENGEGVGMKPLKVV